MGFIIFAPHLQTLSVLITIRFCIKRILMTSISIKNSDIFPYKPAAKYSKRVAYFSMEFAIDQSLKIYSGGLGFLAGSHLRSAYELKQNLLGIGILWSYGYYDQIRDNEGHMAASFTRKHYSFLTDTGLIFPVKVHGAEVYVKAYLLKPEVFDSAPLFLLTTDIEENDALSRTITRKLYDDNEATRVAQSIVLGIGGAKLIDLLKLDVDYYHMNEGHSLPLNFYLMEKHGSINEVRKRVVFTTHTPEAAGNEERPVNLLSDMTFFHHMTSAQAMELMGLGGERLNYTLAALKFAKKANAVSKLHGVVANEMWAGNEGICEITSITNSQNQKYWQDKSLFKAIEDNNYEEYISIKKQMKRELFEIVADQTGKIFDEDVITIVWARRFAGYKRARLIMRNFENFLSMAKSKKYPVQIIWAGKPYPKDYLAIGIFNDIFEKTLELPNCTILTGYELKLSSILKKGSDVWLNNPVVTREASGTSGMTAAMNGSVNFSTPDGWIPEFARHGENCFLIDPASDILDSHQRDDAEHQNLLHVLNTELLPTYYDHPSKWWDIIKASTKEVCPAFESGRMADEYYKKLFV